MSNITKIQTTGLINGDRKIPPADRVLEGTPVTTVWSQTDCNNGKVRVGIAEATEGKTISIKGELCEVVHLLEGVIELTEEGGDTTRFQAGDIFVMKPGFIGTWKTIEKAKKSFVVITP